MSQERLGSEHRKRIIFTYVRDTLFEGFPFRSLLHDGSWQGRLYFSIFNQNSMPVAFPLCFEWRVINQESFSIH